MSDRTSRSGSVAALTSGAVSSAVTARRIRLILNDARAVVEPASRAAVGRLSEPMRTVAGYHLGWCDEHGTPVTAGAGKGLRSALVLGCAQAVAAPVGPAVAGAVAVELVHNFSLLHDDVMDADRARRHRPTAWVVFGVPVAVLAGDALWSLALRVLADSEHPAADQAMRMLSAAVWRLIEGQNHDLAFEHAEQVSVSECVAMATGKTAALMGCACALGGLFGGASPERVDRLRGFGEELGMAFQLVDDLLGMWGNPAVTGKPVHADVQRRKKSLPVVAALGSGTAAGAELARLYQLDRPLTAAELGRAAELVEAGGGRSWAQREADRHLAAALTQLRLANPASRPAAELAALAALITHRDH